MPGAVRLVPLLLVLGLLVLGLLALGFLVPGAQAPAGASARTPGDPPAEVPAPAGNASDARSWPLAGRPVVVRGWEPPAGPYAPGHRGVDLAAPPGTRVLAVAAGRVAFAGRVAGRGVLTVEVAGSGGPPLRTTYEPVRSSVRVGDEVRAGTPVAVTEAGPSHCTRGCLHWGVRRGDTYLDPLSLLPSALLGRGPSRLLPVSGVPLPEEA
ncbi:peptidoglycan DD-metalloendopeptidase family protein [Streptomyces sp. NPDC008125]|uniref:murein hydrolase activator EnvC family protein n=1 Tax=Streptomyces sp. NPDC008125 TaxID=3364811 RepID=UPI0036E8AD06